MYCLSFAPALLYLDIPGVSADSDTKPGRLLFFFVTMALLAEAFQFVWSQLYGRHVIAPAINASRTWEGLVGGSASTALAGMVLYWATPYKFVWQAAFMSMIVAVMGFAGAMTMSAIKRDRGVRDYGTLVEGHGGVLDRIDAICFAAPVFYHVTRQILLSAAMNSCRRLAIIAATSSCRAMRRTRSQAMPPTAAERARWRLYRLRRRLARCNGIDRRPRRRDGHRRARRRLLIGVIGAVDRCRRHAIRALTAIHGRSSRCACRRTRVRVLEANCQSAKSPASAAAGRASPNRSTILQRQQVSKP